MITIPHMDLLDFLCLDNDFAFSATESTLLHSLCDTKIDLIHHNNGSVNFNKTITKFNCTNIVAYEDTTNLNLLYIFLFHDINQHELDYSSTDMKSDMKDIINYITINFPHYDTLNICIIKYVGKAQKISTQTSKCIEKFKKKQNGIMDLYSVCLSINNIETISVPIKL